MAVPLTSGDLSNVDLQSFFSSKGSQVYFAAGKHLSIQDAKILLTKKYTELESGKKMLETLTNLEPHSFKHIQQEFPVNNLQHVTDKSSMDGIYMEECFKIIKSDFRFAYKDFSFWSADIAQKDITAARKKACKEAKEILPESIFDPHEKKISKQFANSPAFNKYASRYGNFKFSFQLSDLLKLYQDQHCVGKEPQLRILGTDLYKQEITHYIVVHSPDQSHPFMNLEVMPTVEDGDHFVHLRDKIVYWRPESTSISLKVKISKDSPGPEKCSQPCDHFKVDDKCVYIKDIKSVWNHLVFAFHLPNHHGLKIQKMQLFRSLKACKIDKSPLLDQNKWLELNMARNFIKEMKPKSQKRKGSSQDPNGPVKKKRTKDPPSQSESPLPSGDTTTGPGPVKKKRNKDPPSQTESPLPSGDTTTGPGPVKKKRTKDPPSQTESPLPSGDTTTGPAPVKNKCTKDPPPQSELPLPSDDTTTGPEETPITDWSATRPQSALEL
ncbi:uncharacterized protein [Aquarana catesbeiana]|uniref:uncharacterized protein n=1 Tax=Aquarana catesbeiana TaxID=8400 RepID=UPI003CC98BD7